MRKALLAITLTFSYFQTALLYAQIATSKDIDSQRSIYISADHAFKKHDFKNYKILADKIQSYPLYPYLIYEELKYKIANSKPLAVKAQDLTQFAQTYPDFPYINTLRNLLLTRLAKEKNWAAYTQLYEKSDQAALQCHYYYGKFQLTQNIAYLEQGKKLWLVGYPQPDACKPLFSTLQKNGLLTQTLQWKKIKLAFEEKNFDLAKHSIKELPSAVRPAALLWEKCIKNPKLLLAQTPLSPLPPTQDLTAAMLTQTLSLLAKQDADQALTWWKTHQKNYAFTDFQQHHIENILGMYLSHQKSPQAAEWLAHLPPEALDTIAKEWRIRLSIGAQKWNDVLSNIEALPETQQQEPSWRYWRARALEKLGRTEQANNLYKLIAKTRTYYGLLASVRLKQPFVIQHQPVPVDAKTTKEVTALPAIQRFEQLRLVKKPEVARVEWFRALDKMSDKQIDAAAKIAQKMELYDIAILTISRSSHKDDIPLRFPLAYEQEMIQYAKKQQIDPAWAFAITRQESAFYPEALSPAGARGLMQIMPATGKMLAKQQQVPYASDAVLHNPKMNIQLGTAYLKDLKKRSYDHPVIATSAYNAGPSRTSHWLPSESTPVDIWVDTLPYRETRDYIKNVMTFTAIYRNALGLPHNFSQMMQPINTQK